MKVGLISDLHGDRVSLEQALNALIGEHVDRIVCAGDLVEKGPDSEGVVTLVREYLIPSVQGNHDANAVRHARWPMPHEAERSPLADDTIAWLDELPLTRDYMWEGQRVLMAHGTPGNQVGYVTPESIPKAFRRRLRTLDADVLILGHTHIPMCLEIGHVTIVNPGSVCNLRPRDSHTCAILYLPERRLEVLEL